MSENIVAKFVQVEQETVLIDSRVYCREIIEVDHADWLSDTLAKYQSAIESSFGLIRYETDAVTILGQRGTKYVKYALLTEPQCNACLVLSKNLKKTIQAKFQLVADFEQSKQLIKLNFERSLGASVSAVSAEVSAEPINLDPFPKTINELHKDSGIVSPSYVRNSVKLGFKRDIDWTYDPEDKKCTPTAITLDCYYISMIAFRSKDGSDKTKLPEIIPVARDKYYKNREKYKKPKANELLPHEQLNLF